MRPDINSENTETLFETRFIKVYDLQYAPGRHYFDASRRAKQDLIALKGDEEAKTMLPDAVTCFVVIRLPGGDDRLLLTYEFRYPAGRFLLSPIAGLIDPEDREAPEPILTTARRELTEETGLSVGEGDRVFTVAPLLYSTPGMTDECNATAAIVLRRDTLDGIRQDGAVGTECFDGWLAVTRAEAEEMLRTGRDPKGNFFSVYTWCALMWFARGEY